MTEDQARKRFFLLTILRFSGVAIAFLGIAVIMKRLIEPADIVGTVLLAIGVFDVLVLPTILMRRWKSER
ncbi:MAG: hypothetical protein ABI898_03805 [Sphingomonadales bacterium]